LRFNSPLRLVYVLIVEVTTKVRVSFTFLPLSSNHKGKLEFFTRKSRVTQTSQGSPIDPTDLTKKSSDQALNQYFSHQVPCSQLNLLQDLNLGAKRRRREELES
jgi:hypothetical protein